MKKLLFTCAIISTAFLSCKKDKKEDATPSTSTTTTPTTTTGTNTFTFGLYGTYTAPATNVYGGVVTLNTNNLAFAFVGTQGSGSNPLNGGGNIYFHLGATTGTYNVIATTRADTIAANQVALDMSGGPDVGLRSRAQSGTVSLTVTGSKYKIVYNNLPSLDNDSPPKTDVLSGDFTFE